MAQAIIKVVNASGAPVASAKWKMHFKTYGGLDWGRIEGYTNASGTTPSFTVPVLTISYHLEATDVSGVSFGEVKGDVPTGDFTAIVAIKEDLAHASQSFTSKLLSSIKNHLVTLIVMVGVGLVLYILYRRGTFKAGVKKIKDAFTRRINF